MTAAFGLRTCALALCLVMAVRAKPVPDASQCTVSSPTWNDTCSVCVRGTTVRWAVGDGGRVLKMVNGDTTAGYIVGKGQYDLCGVSFADANRGWIVGGKREEPERARGAIFRTTTGGRGPEAWTACCPAIRPDVQVPFLKVQAMDVRHVWVTCGGGYMLYTNDGGARWAVTAKQKRPGNSGTAEGDPGK